MRRRHWWPWSKTAAEAAKAAEQGRAELERIRNQWPEVRRVGGAAREHREANHLSELFAAYRGSK